MAAVITDEGLDWLKNKIFNAENDEVPYIVAIGDGTNSPSPTDTSLQNELYRANNDDSNCDVRTTTDTGEFEYRITVSGGTEVPAGTDISEVGLITSGTNEFLYREVRSPVINVASGDRKTLGAQITFTD